MTSHAVRSRVPRSSHGEWEPAPDRPDPVALLEAQAADRIGELVPIRYGRMLASPLSFYRGAAAIMAADLAPTPTSGITVQLCGDAHLSNFGVFAAPDRRLVFDINDFDETSPGPWEWDVKRLAASMEIAGRHLDFRPRERRAAVLATVRAYREAMRGFAAAGNLDVWYARMDVADELERLAPSASRAEVKSARHALARARRKDSLRALERLTERVDGELRFAAQPPLLVPVADLLGEADADALRASIQSLLDQYAARLSPELRHLMSTYRAVDMARKVVGVGSVGTRAWIVLLQGRDENDPLVLQAKEAQTSVLEAHTGPSGHANHGERVVQGQRFMQAAGDLFLSWERFTGIDGVQRDFYIRQLWDGKGSADVETMTPQRLTLYAGMCGWTLARAHARSGDRAAIAEYLGSGDVFDRALAAFADAYADRNESDVAELERAVADGRIAAQHGI